MLLRQLFVKIKPVYEGDGTERATREIDKVDNATKRLNKSLNILTAAFSAAGLAGLHAFTGWDRALTSLAGKAGLTRREFDRLYGSASSAVARSTGAQRVAVASGFQQAHSLGLQGTDAQKLVTMGATLQQAGMAQLQDVVENSIRIANQGFGGGDASVVADAITRGAQVGAGEMATYFASAGKVMQFSEAFGIDLNEMVGALTILSQAAPTMREGATQFEGFLTALNNPTKDTENTLAEMGTTGAELKQMIRDEGLGAVFEFLSQFSDDQLNALTPGNKESAKFITAMAKNTELMAANTKAVMESKGTVEGVAKDVYPAFSTALDRLKRSFEVFLVEYGRPFAKLLRPFIVAASGLLNGLITLSEATNGLIMYVPALITALLGLRLALIGARRVGGFVAPLFGGGDRDGKDGAANKGGKWSIADIGKVVVGVLGLGGVGLWIKRMMGDAKIARVLSRSGGGIGVSPGAAGAKRAAMINRMARVNTLLRGFVLALTGATAALVGIGAAIAGLFIWKGSQTDAGQDMIGKLNDPAFANQQKAELAAEWILLKATLNTAWEKLMGVVRAGVDKFKEIVKGVVYVVGRIAGISPTLLEAWGVKIEAGIDELMETIGGVLGAIWWAITNPIDAIMAITRWYLQRWMNIISTIIDWIPGVDSPEIDAAKAQVDAIRKGKHITFKDGALFVDGEQIGTTALPDGMPVPPESGIKGDVNIHTEINIDAPGADDPAAIGRAVEEAMPDSLKAWDANRVFQNNQTFQFGG